MSHNDETGVLGARFNDLLDTLRDLSSAAGALAKGDLEIRLVGEGDVATAFRAMIESLGRIVRQIHETSVLLAAAATEIYAASQEQEAAAASQSTAMVEIRQTMESLFEAAAHVSESVRGVLSNAERTLETTDRMVVRIGDLTNHAGRIGEILETIRDISDRSDLLALNGALEASRAGEAGRGFGLVAAEMRRLAERVMSSVHDVRSLVGDIRASGSSTMMATEDSKKLAASTTDAARQITLVTQQQRSGTEQVLQSVREIAETLTQSVAAMAQTRASAEQLKSQADKLSSLVRAFRIENAADVSQRREALIARYRVISLERLRAIRSRLDASRRRATPRRSPRCAASSTRSRATRTCSGWSRSASVAHACEERLQDPALASAMPPRARPRARRGQARAARRDQRSRRGRRARSQPRSSR